MNTLRVLSIVVTLTLFLGGGVGTVTLTPSCAGNALQFDGTDRVQIPHDASLSFPVGANFTVELWINPSDTSGIKHFLGKRVAAATQCEGVEYQLALDDGQSTNLHFTTSPSNLNIKLYSTSFLTPDTWVHVTVTYDGTTLLMYLDGVLNASRVAPFGQPNLADLTIGTSSNCGNSFEGLIDEVRIWDVTRSPSEIAQSYNETVSPSASGLVGYWNFDEDISDQNVFDISGSGNDGTRGFDSEVGTDDPPRVLSTAPIVGGPTCDLPISLDIKPGSCPNSFNVRSGNGGDYAIFTDADLTALAKTGPGMGSYNSLLPVAILGTADFDIMEIDPTTVTLEGVPLLRHSFSDVATPMPDESEPCDCNDDGGDGFTDIELQFNKSDIIDAISPVMDGDIVELTIAGELYDGTLFEGTDCVLIRGNSGSFADRFGGNRSLPGEFSLGNYPNPFNPRTVIGFSLPEAASVKLEVFNVSGQTVATLFNGPMEAGSHTVTWDGSAVASGIYLYRLTTEKFSESRKMLLLK